MFQVRDTGAGALFHMCVFICKTGIEPGFFLQVLWRVFLFVCFALIGIELKALVERWEAFLELYLCAGFLFFTPHPPRSETKWFCVLEISWEGPRLCGAPSWGVPQASVCGKIWLIG